ncbi:MAG: TVP38/TMEM64 family protein [Mycoplasmatales bacterium]
MDSSWFLEILNQYAGYAILISIIANIIVAILGVVPSVFITIGNVLFFGYVNGFIISIIGEAIGAVISFLLYRKGFKKMNDNMFSKNDKVQKLMHATKRQGMELIFSFRLFPYMPSGFVTYGAAVSNIGVLPFTIASTLGKIPSLLIEVIVSGLILGVASKLPMKTIITIVSLVLIVFILRKIFKKESKWEYYK